MAPQFSAGDDARHVVRLKTVRKALPDVRLSRCYDFRGPYGNRSAAQNGTVIQTCKQCGAINQASTERCCFCEAQLNAEPAALVSATAAAGTSQLSSSQSPIAIAAPEWRGEIAQRMRSYRARRNGEPEESENGAPQTALPFEAATEKTAAAIEDEMDDPLQAALASAAARAAELPSATETDLAQRTEPKIYERLEIDVSRPAASATNEAPLPANARRYEGVLDPRTEPVYPVASLQLRRRAAIIDATILALASLAIFSGFIALGGRFVAGKTEILICIATIGLLAAQYFTLFTIMGGTTPGMMITGLRLVSFEGDAPAPSQLIWRSIGYLISGGTAFLGYLWSLWDEDELTWHDRISQTYITPAEAGAPAEAHPTHGPSESHP